MDYRIDYTITRRADGESDFTEVGFGSSGSWDSVDQAAHMLVSAVQNREWETSGDMPDPADHVTRTRPNHVEGAVPA